MEWVRFVTLWWQRATDKSQATSSSSLQQHKNQAGQLRNLTSDWRILTGTGAAVALAAGFALYRRFHHAPTTEELERRRRLRINQIGRIVEGQVTQLMEVPPAPPKSGGLLRPRPQAGRMLADGSRKLVCYSYSISGVTYETAQDVTGLEERVRLNLLAAGQSASVKYNPSNPSDSIVVADDWSGVH